MEGGRGENRQVILVGTELLHLPRVRAGLGIQFGVAEYFLELGVVEGAWMDGSTFSNGGGGPVGPMEGREPGHGVGGDGPLAGRGGWVDLSEGGVVGGRWRLWGEQCGLRGELWGS